MLVEKREQILIPYEGLTEILVAYDDGRIPRAERTLTHAQRYALKEQGRVGQRVSGATIKGPIRSRAEIGMQRLVETSLR